MRNIFLLPTPNRSRLILQGSTLHLSKYMEVNEGFSEFNQYVYITSDSEIIGWYIYEDKLLHISKNHSKYELLYGKPVILTTDPELIGNGVQPIPYEFLQWFVNNPTCEEVKVEHGVIDVKGGLEFAFNVGYKIIIPKQEMLEENEFCHYSGLPSPAAYATQEPKEEKKYSEEDFKLFARQYYREIKMDKSNLLWEDLADKCLEQFKNK
jgi:hypothetical protein